MIDDNLQNINDHRKDVQSDMQKIGVRLNDL